ncbi:heavy metal-binding domain-containing protein [Gemmatimonadota bacterium]
MKKLTIAGLAVLFMVTVAAAGMVEDKQYGEPLTIEKVTPLKDIIASPGDFVGKEVRTAGYIYEMCTSSGCWIGILPSIDSEDVVKISWMETDVRFPIGEETTGHYIEIQGEIITAEQEVVDHEAHMEAEGMEEGHEEAEAAPEGTTRTVFTCPMHPDVQSETRDRCSICNMYLTPHEIALPTYGALAVRGIGAIVKEKK